ncbi:MAG: hypothetical protein HY822_02250 [Acidobacteria bacterium]|nr:hypothetical protein [Acidobacteriota bacterium]
MFEDWEKPPAAAQPKAAGIPCNLKLRKANRDQLPVNHTTLNDFRKNKKEALDEAFTRLLVMLEGEGLMDLERVRLDGTKVAAREREQRLEQAVEELKSLQGEKKTEEEKAAVRVSLSDPPARIMKHGDGAMGPAYNVQISTDGKQKVIVGVQVNQCSADAPALPEALDQVQERMGKTPLRMVVEGGYTSKANVILAEERKIDLIGSPGDAGQRVANALKSSGIGPGF